MTAPVPASESRDLVPVVNTSPKPDQNPALVYLAGRPSAVGRRGLQRSLDLAAEVLTGGLATSGLLVAWPQVRYQHITAMRSLLIDSGRKPATVNHVLAAVRGTLREAWRLGFIDAEALARVTDVKNVPSSTLPAGRHVDGGEVAALFRACGDEPVGARDAAMLALLYGCGLRRSEAVALLLDDYNADAVTVKRGKGRKERFVYPPRGGREAIEAWLARRGDWPGALLAPVRKGGHIEQRAMTDQAVLLRLRTLAERARVAPFTPHDLRRSFVGELLDAGADISSVQGLAGHSSIDTTSRYDRRPEDAKRRTAEKLLVPYVRPLLLAGTDSPPAPAKDADPATAPEPAGTSDGDQPG